MATEAIHRPFSNGTEFDIWHGHNCQQCAKFNPDSADCDLEAILLLGGDEDRGGLSEVLAQRCGYLAAGPTPGYHWRCAEFVSPEPPADQPMTWAEKLHGIDGF